MTEFIKGLDLCESFFNECALDIIKTNYPDLKFTAGLLGYGSDVLGYDDSVSTDHMWGPRFYLFLSEVDIHLKDKLMSLFEANLPYQYKGFSVNFSEPDPNDGGVRHPEFINSGNVSPLIWIHTIDEFLGEYLGVSRHLTTFDWLAVSEHRLLGFTSGRLFVDMLGLAGIRTELNFYPEDVKLYLITSQWALIGEEQAFAKRCGDCGDELGSRIVCTRIVERLMRLCFLYNDEYAPYSKWLGTGFNHLPIDDDIKQSLSRALSADSVIEREEQLVKAQSLVARLHNKSTLTDEYEISIQTYFGRDISVIFADRLAEMVKDRISDQILKKLPLIGSLSQIGNFVELSDNPVFIHSIKQLYENIHLLTETY